MQNISARIADRLALFPNATHIENDSLCIAGQNLTSLADKYGTPLYVYDCATLDAAVADYQSALQKHYPAPSQITYAGKAFLCKAIAKWTQTHHLFVDCTGETEIAIATRSSIPRENILVHGVNKSFSDLQTALKQAGTIVVDNITELHHIHVILSEATLAPHASAGENLYQDERDSPRHSLAPYARTGVHPGQVSVVAPKAPLPQSDINLWLRLLPGITVTTHHSHTQTGQHDSKFGMTPAELMKAAQFCEAHNLPLKGIHFHLGSNFRDPEPLLPAIDMALDLAKQIGFKNEWHFCPGGGWGDRKSVG